LINVWLLDLAGLAASFLFLVYASWRDIATREVTNRLWIVSYPAGFILLGARLLAQPELWQLIVVSIAITSVVSLGLSLLGLWGGADAKGFICLAINNPIVPVIGGVMFRSVDPFFPLIVFSNSFLASLASLIYPVQRNLRSARLNNLFVGFEGESTFDRIAAFFIGYRVTFDELRSSHFLFPIEYTDSQGPDPRRRFRFELRVDRDPLKELAEIKGTAGPGRSNDKVWVSPGLPFIVFIAAGLALSIMFGDIIWCGVSAVMRSLASTI